MSKDISFNVGNFKVLKSDININSKNFIGYDDDDYETVEMLNSSDINIATNNSMCVKNSVYIGFDKDKIKQKIEQMDNMDNLNKDNNNLIVNGNTELDGDVLVSNKLFVQSNCFLNQDVFINNTLNLPNEDLEQVDFFKFSETNISFQSYKFLLSNILENIKITTNKQIFSLKFINKLNFVVQSILSVYKKFFYKEKIINCYMLVYVLHNKNLIIDVKPIMDTFSLLDNENNLIKIFEEE